MAEETKTTSTQSDSYFKDGEYREYTNIYGVYHGDSPKRHGVKGRLKSKHDSLDQANQAAKALFDEYDTKTAVYATLDLVSGRYFGQIAYFRSVIRIEVEELPLDKLNQCELKQLRATYEIENTTDKRPSELRKKDLIELLVPTIQHKKHQNRKKEKDIASCLMCRELHKEEYDALMKQRDNDPFWKKQKIFTKMYRASLRNPITIKQVKVKYGAVLTSECLENGVLEEKLHWRNKSCFGNQYNVYEKEEIEKYYNEVKETQSATKADKKRKHKEMNSNEDDALEAQGPETKKRKTNV